MRSFSSLFQPLICVVAPLSIAGFDGKCVPLSHTSTDQHHWLEEFHPIATSQFSHEKNSNQSFFIEIDYYYLQLAVVSL